MFYNVTDWRPFLDKRLPKDSILQEKILKVSILIGEFARDAIDASGGLNSDGSLTNPCSHIRINESEVNEFYQNIDALLGEIHNMNKNSDVYKDLNTILQYNFYREKGSLSRNVLLSSSVEKVAAKLLVFENYCYFLIVKYA
jgi:hypothetical protein